MKKIEEIHAQLPAKQKINELAKEYYEKAGIDFSKGNIQEELLIEYTKKTGKEIDGVTDDLLNFCIKELKDRIQNLEQ